MSETGAAGMNQNNTTHWAEGLCFVQLQKDSANQNRIKHSPHQAMFGTRARVGLADAEILDSLASRKTWKMSFHLPLGTREFELEGVLFYFDLLFSFKNNKAFSFLVFNFFGLVVDKIAMSSVLFRNRRWKSLDLRISVTGAARNKYTGFPEAAKRAP